jgi:hypothetical protein
LADDTYSHLLLDLARRNFTNASPELRNNILSYYSDPSAPFHDKRNKKHWEETLGALQQLKSAQSNSVVSGLAAQP